MYKSSPSISVFQFHDLLHATFVSHNMMSVHKLFSNNNVTIEFNTSIIFVKYVLSQRVLAKGKVIDDFYTLDGTLLQHSQGSYGNVVNSTNTMLSHASTVSLFISSIMPYVWH